MIYRVRGPTFYYNTRCALTTHSALNWKGARVFSGRIMLDGRSPSGKQGPWEYIRGRLAAPPLAPLLRRARDSEADVFVDEASSLAHAEDDQPASSHFRIID